MRRIAIIPIIVLLAMGGALMALTGSLSAQGFRTIGVTVLDAAGRPVSGATVCAGSATGARGDLGSARTDALGRATMAVGAPESPTPVAPAILVTASTANAGGSVNTPTALATVRLSAGGPRCPSAPPTVQAPGTFLAPSASAIRNQLPTPAPSFHPVEINLGKRCFGAAGANCANEGGEMGTCSGDTCTINRGSWEHDECCFANPAGGVCDDKPWEVITAQGIGGRPEICMPEFNLAVARLSTPFSWQRRVNFQTRNSSGIVVHSEYCASRGEFVPVGEERFCCSRGAGRLNAADTIRFMLRPGATPVTAAQARMCS